MKQKKLNLLLLFVGGWVLKTVIVICFINNSETERTNDTYNNTLKNNRTRIDMIPSNVGAECFSVFTVDNIHSDGDWTVYEGRDTKTGHRIIYYSVKGKGANPGSMVGLRYNGR